jgi:hypothetical protein
MILGDVISIHKNGDEEQILLFRSRSGWLEK